MTISRTTKLTTFALLLCTVVSVCYSAETNDAATSTPELDFVFKDSSQVYNREKDAQPAIVPTHCAEIEIRWYHHEPTSPEAEELLDTSAAKSFSPLQQEFLKTGKALRIDVAKRSTQARWVGSFDEGYISCSLFAVSRDDAKKMAEAFTEIFLKQNSATSKRFLDDYLKKWHNLQSQQQKLIAETKAQIPIKEQQLKKLRTEFDQLKAKSYCQSKDQALAAILDLNKMLYTVKIEFAGMEAKVVEIQEHRDRISQMAETDNNAEWEPVLLNLEQKYIDVMIDYEAAKAREKTVQNLRGETQSFINKDNEISATGVKVRELKNNLEEQESTLRGIEDQLANPDDNMLPLGIFKNRAYIHLVHTQILE